jgi:predicted amidohydrolase YtcJ
VGKWADFVMFDKDIMKIKESEILKWNLNTYLKDESQIKSSLIRFIIYTL